MNERRTHPRRKEVQQARIFFNDRKSGCGCVVNDFSAKGARLGISERDRVPDEFELYVPLKQKAFPARVRWRRENELGVTFIHSDEPRDVAASMLDLQKRIDKIETDISKLHQQLHDLAADVRRTRP